MKPFWGIDLTTDKKNEQANGEEFLTAKPSLALTQSLERTSEDLEETIAKSKLPLALRIVQWGCLILGVAIVGGIIRLLTEGDSIPLKQMYQQAPWLFWLCGASLAVWLILTLIGTRKEKVVLEADESLQTFENLDDSCEAIFSELGVPADAPEIDVLSFFYKVKGDEIKVCEKAWQLAPYMNPIFHIFADSENLYLANLEGKYTFSLSSVKAIKSVKKTIRIVEWNKDEPCNKGVYKPYKLSEGEDGCISCKNYHIVEIERDSERWGIYIPCYELPVIEQLTGLKAEAL